jgi:hypothetical protein
VNRCPKIVLHPGHARAPAGHSYFVHARELASLYGVPFEQCVVYQPSHPVHRVRPLAGDVSLYPDESGEYKLPTEAAELLGLCPCRSPYCECEQNKCSHPGCYDARATVTA